MPELPEVETITSQLDRKLKDKVINSVDVFLPKLIRYPVSKFKKLVKGVKILCVKRRGKLIIIELANSFLLVIHLKLSGQLIYNGKRGKHTHVIYHFNDKSCLVHNDLRRFGFVKVINKEEFDAFVKGEKLGPEPLDVKFTLKLFKWLLLKRKKAIIKTLLMDQSFIVGIGNIYANEILFEAGIQPKRKVQSLKNGEIEKLYKTIKKILKLAIRKGGSSDRDYVDAGGEQGDYMKIAKVYHREGKPCFICKNKIKRIKMGGRSSFYCSKCQK